MVREVLKYPEDKDNLSLISSEIALEDIKSEKIQTLIQDLKDTLHSSTGGAGISAIQIGEPLCLCIVNYEKEYVLINPKITWRRTGPHGEKEFLEGCLSVPGKYIKVKRSQKVICEYLDENGEAQKLEEGGWLSAIIQHELDHMNGTCALFEDEKTE